MSYAKAASVLVSLAVVSGCASIPGLGRDQDSGQIAYRIAEQVAVTEAAIAEHSSNDPLAPAKLIRQYSGTRNAFNSTPATPDDREVYSIALEQAVIGSFVGETRFAQPAEVAILANAFEFDAADGAAASNRFYEFPEITGPRENEDGSASPVSGAMKLIYFSPDVFLRQPLNFSALPIVPPTRYNGRPIGIQLVVMELDRIPGPVKSLLRELAALGQASNVTNAAPGIGKVALDLGTSFLDGNSDSDDIVFEYRMVLYPQHLASSAPGAGPANEMATFQPGRYVLRRMQIRNRQMEWKDLRLDHNTGRLFRVGTDGSYVEHREEMYAVLNIVRHPPGTPEAQYAFQTLADLDTMIEAAASTDGTQALDAITKNIAARVKQVRSNAWLTNLNNRWNTLEGHLRALEISRYPGLDTKVGIAEEDQSVCDAGPKAALNSDWVAARLRVREAAIELVTQYKLALAALAQSEGSGDTSEDSQTTADSQFTEEDQRILVNRIARYAVPRNEALDTEFSTRDAFVTAYVGDDKSGTELASALIGAVQNVPVSYSCEQLKERGWFEEKKPADPAQ